MRYLPGRGGESPVEGFKAGGVARPAQLLGIALAAVASVRLGAVIGPEAPLVALGGGLAFLVVCLAKRDALEGPVRWWPPPGASRRSARCQARRRLGRSCLWRPLGWAGRQQ